MNLWLTRLKDPVPAGLKTPAELARFELAHALPDTRVTLEERPDLGAAGISPQSRSRIRRYAP